MRSCDSEAVVVVAVHTRGTTVTVYNFEVAETHTYFVATEAGGMAVGVHNDCLGRRNLHAALGINDKDQLFEFGYKTKSYWYGEWHEGGLLDYQANSAHFADDFSTAMNRATQIHFNLDGIQGDLEAYRQLGGTGNFGSVLWTARELYLITTNPAWHAKTIFYQAGEALLRSPFIP